MRRILPIPSSVPLVWIARHLRRGDVIGVWVTAAGRSWPRTVYRSTSVFVSADLGALLGRVERVLVWGGDGCRALAVGSHRPVDHSSETPVG
jgi:hypothetical protein